MASNGEPRKRRGEAAERLAERHLEAAGLEVLARNYRCRAGELDLICGERGTLVIVEVRQRSRQDFGGPLASVGRLKQRRIVLTTEFFRMHSRQWSSSPVRFDVVALLGSPDREHELVWIKDAFRV